MKTAADLVKELRTRADLVMAQLHALTLRRDAGWSLVETMPLEQRLVMELGRLQDRLRLLGEHDYDGCPACRPPKEEPACSTN